MGGTYSRYDNDTERVVVVSKELTLNLMKLLGKKYNNDINNERLKELINEAKLLYHPSLGSDVINDMNNLVKLRNRIVHEHNYDKMYEKSIIFDSAYERVSYAIKKVTKTMDQLDHDTCGKDIQFVVVSYKNMEEKLRKLLNRQSSENGWTLIKNAKNVLSGRSNYALREVNTLRNNIVHDLNKNSLTVSERESFTTYLKILDQGIDEQQRIVLQGQITTLNQGNIDESSDSIFTVTNFIFAGLAIAAGAAVISSLSERDNAEEEERRRKNERSNR